MKKKIVLLLIIIFCVLGCEKKQEIVNENIQRSEIAEDLDMEEVLINKYNFKINNSASVSSLKQEYSIKDLKSYFGLYSFLENYIYDDANFKDISEINEKYPIELLKRNNGVVYTVYKVKEGGNFYLFFGLYGDTDIILGDPIYIDNLKNKNDFDSLEINHSTYEDLIAISSATDIDFLLSHGTYSYTLLDDGMLLEVRYDYPEEVRGRNDLVINSISVVNDGSTKLKSIYKSDLPL